MLKVLVVASTGATLIFCCCLASTAQSRRSTQVLTKETSQEKLEQEAKTNFALSLINTLADEARKYDDRATSVRVQARAADLLWETDVERARSIFRRVWVQAEEVEEAEQKLVEEKKRKFLSGESQNGFIPLPPNLRGEILQLVGRRDKKLSEELLTKLKEKNEENDETAKDDFDPTEPDLATARRLELALYLLENGETDKAIAIADASLQRATTQGIIFLIALRKKMPVVADARYSNLLTKSAIDPTSDATSVSLLSSYVFTPTVIVTMTQNGTVSRSLDTNSPSQIIPESLKFNFLKSAAQILLRPIPLVEQDKTSAKRDGLYFTITRLLPLFEQYLPDKVPFLQSQMGIITQSISSEVRERTDFFSKAGLSSEDPRERQLEDILQEISSSKNDHQTDNLYAQAARLAVAKNDARARDWAEKISNPSLRDKVSAFVDFTLIQKLIEKKDADKALALLKKAKLPQLQRIWFMTEIANLFGAKREFEARTLLDEAATEAQKVSRDEMWKSNAISAVATTYLAYDKWRSWQLASEAVKAANNSDFFNDKPDLSTMLEINGSTSIIKLNAQNANVVSLFAKLAPYDIYQAADLANSLSNDYQKALSLLAVASSQIKKKT